MMVESLLHLLGCKNTNNVSDKIYKPPESFQLDKVFCDSVNSYGVVYLIWPPKTILQIDNASHCQLFICSLKAVI